MRNNITLYNRIYMNSPQFQADIKSLIHQLQKKQRQLEDARKKDLVFKEIKKLYLEMKELNQILQKSFQENDVDKNEREYSYLTNLR